MHRRVTSSIVALEIYAAFLACVQLLGGLRTDEAKYLLNIPYPHPPVFRFLLSLTLSMPLQELFWRFFIASVVVQSAWMIWDMAAVLQRERKVALVMAWLFSAPIILQGGTIMTVVPTAIFGLFFVWHAFDQREWKPSQAPLIALTWLLALFTAYQSILFAPLVFSLLRKTHCSRYLVMYFLVLPALLLGLYSLANPLAAATMLAVTTQDAAVPLMERITTIASVWLLSGGLLTGLGLWGVWISGRRDLLLTTILLLGCIALSAQDYYAILLVPVLIAGLFVLFCRRRASTAIFILGHLVSTAVLLLLHFPPLTPSLSKSTIPFLKAQGVSQLILIDGPFGHEWQYESTAPIGRFSQNLSVQKEDQAGAIVCTKKTCEEDIDREKWVRIEGAPTEVWVRR